MLPLSKVMIVVTVNLYKGHTHFAWSEKDLRHAVPVHAPSVDRGH